MNDNYDEVFSKFPTAKKIAVENFTMSYDKFDTNAANNLAYDARVYKWNKDTVNAIKYYFKKFKG